MANNLVYTWKGVTDLQHLQPGVAQLQSLVSSWDPQAPV